MRPAGAPSLPLHHLPYARFVPASPRLPISYFPARDCNNVRLYGDADAPVRIPLGERHSYWEDLYEALCDAKYFIFIVGWSINAHVRIGRRRRASARDESFLSHHIDDEMASRGPGYAHYGLRYKQEPEHCHDDCVCFAKKKAARVKDDLLTGYWEEVEVLGELLKRKAAEGLEVVLLIWDDMSSSRIRKSVSCVP